MVHNGAAPKPVEPLTLTRATGIIRGVPCLRVVPTLDTEGEGEN